MENFNCCPCWAYPAGNRKPFAICKGSYFTEPHHHSYIMHVTLMTLFWFTFSCIFYIIMNRKQRVISCNTSRCIEFVTLIRSLCEGKSGMLRRGTYSLMTARRNRCTRFWPHCLSMSKSWGKGIPRLQTWEYIIEWCLPASWRIGKQKGNQWIASKVIKWGLFKPLKVSLLESTVIR